MQLSAVAVAIMSLVLLGLYCAEDAQFFKVENHYVEIGIFAFELIIGAFLFYKSVRNFRIIPAALVAIQVGLVLWFEFAQGNSVRAEYSLFIDRFTLILTVIIGVVGGLIVAYAVPYMQDYHELDHPEVRDGRPVFFFLMFLFLSAMFGIVFSNNLNWLLFFWEITTLCSFLLIGYKKDQESTNNAFKALTFNMLGGIAFSLAVYYLAQTQETIELNKMLNLDRSLVLLPATLLGFAGLTKAAQLPFSTWLLGAMVAPTPVSALLHSSTMVKAGVYILIKIAPILQGTFVGFMFALIGMFTFLMASFLAISQRDAKKILAYSTIANLGLIVACGGIGTYESVWAGVLLIIFHALAKGLLFLCVGVAEHQLHSRDVEMMEGIIYHLPRIGWMLLIGMAGMFLAPFGMLISKWAVLKAFLDANILLAMILIFGSAATLFYWVKWMGKIIMVVHRDDVTTEHLHRREIAVLEILALLTIAMCGFFPLISSLLIEPYVVDVLKITGQTLFMSKGNITIMMIMLGLLLLFPCTLPDRARKKKMKTVDPFLCGANTDGGRQFRNSLGGVTAMEIKNYYLSNYFSERALLLPALAVGSVLTVVLFLGVLR